MHAAGHDEEYTKKIKEYTTEPRLQLARSPSTCPTPKPSPRRKPSSRHCRRAPILPYSTKVYKYMRLLEQASPRVKVFPSLGHSEEGREMIAVAVASYN